MSLSRRGPGSDLWKVPGGAPHHTGRARKAPVSEYCVCVSRDTNMCAISHIVSWQVECSCMSVMLYHMVHSTPKLLTMNDVAIMSSWMPSLMCVKLARLGGEDVVVFMIAMCWMPLAMVVYRLMNVCVEVCGRATTCIWSENGCVDGLDESLLNRVRCCSVDPILFFISLSKPWMRSTNWNWRTSLDDGCLCSGWWLDCYFLQW